MATYNQIAYLIYDELKLGSDDESLNIDHIIFLMNNWRAFILKQKYTDLKKEVPISNYQTICVDLVHNKECITGEEVVSVNSIPNLINLNGNESISITPIGDFFNSIEFTLISNSRFPYTGLNKWLKKIIYFTIGTNNKLYLRSSNPDFKYIKKVNVHGLFENTEEASKLSCNGSSENCNYLDSKFPLEEGYIPLLVELILKELGQIIYNPEDTQNDAKDNLSEVRISNK